MSHEQEILTDNDFDFVRLTDGNPMRFSRQQLDLFKASLERSERVITTMPWASTRGEIIVPTDTLRQKSLADRIFAVVTAAKFRKGPRAFADEPDSKAKLMSKIILAIKHQMPLEIVLPCLPFKDRNPLRTQAPADFVDLGEIVCLVKMFELARTVEAIFSSGCVITLITDGVIYQDLFGVSLKDAISFRTKLERLVANLGIAHNVKIVDMVSLVRNSQEFNCTRSRIEEELLSGRWGHKMTSLEQGMAVNIDLSRFSIDVLFHALNSEIEVPTDLRENVLEARGEIKDQAHSIAIKYAAILIALKKLEVIEGRFPNAVRGTVHPKPGQLGLHLVNSQSSIGSYHGVPIWQRQRGLPRNWKNIKIRYEIDVRSRPNIVPRFLEGQSHPFFFEQII